MDIRESSRNFAKDTSGMSDDTNLSKKSFDEISKTVVGLVETNKDHELKIQKLEKRKKNERSFKNTRTLY